MPRNDLSTAAIVRGIVDYRNHSAIAKFRFVVSKVVADECAAGDADAAKERLDVLASLEFIGTSPSVDELAGKLIEEFAIPKTEPRDAIRISLAAVNGLENLVSWNFKHIVNPTTRSAIEHVCRELVLCRQ